MPNTTSNIRNIQRARSGLTIHYTNGTKEFKTFQDYFYVTKLELIYGQEDPEKHKAIIKDLKKTIEILHIPNIKDIQFCKKDVGEIYTTREVCCLKITVNDNFKTREIAEKIKLIKEVQVFEHDVEIGYKYLFAHNINPIQYPEKGLSVLSFDLETKYEKGVDPINQEIISCAFVYKDKNGDISNLWIGYSNLEKEEIKTITVNSEVELINKIFYYLENLNYDILTGFNINGFDLPCLVNRAKVNNLAPNLPIKVNGKFINGNLTYKIGTIIDCYDLIEHKFLGLKTKRPEVKIKAKNLKYIAHNYLDNDKIEYSFLTPVEQFAEEDYSKLIQYNVQDAWLCINLLEKYNYLKEIPAICNASKILLKDWQSASRIHDKIISREFYERNYLIPEKKDHKKIDYKGGLVIGEQGVYKNVVVLDISGSYPSAILYANISNDSLTLNTEVEDVFTTPTGTFINKEIKEGAIAKLTRNFRTERNKHKKQSQNKGDLHDNMQYAYKILANSLYGSMGYERFRYYNPSIASSVTYIARNNLTNLINIAKEYGEVIYCDTDSVFIKTNTTGIKNLLELGNRIEKEINHKIKYKGFEIELKYITPKLIVEAQKKYFCHAYLENKNWYEIKGMESKRSDTIDYASRKIEKIIKDVADYNKVDLDKEIEVIKKEIREVEIEELSKTKKLSKKKSEYVNTPEHLRACLNSGIDPDEVDVVNYVNCKDKVYLTEYAKEHNLEIDYDYYLNNLILPAVNRIKGVLKGNNSPVSINLNTDSRKDNNKKNNSKEQYVVKPIVQLETKEDYIRYYRSKQLNLIPDLPSSKETKVLNWTEYCRNPAPEFKLDCNNIGIPTGYNGFHALDFDTLNGYASFKKYLEEIGIKEEDILAHSATEGHRTLWFRDIKGRMFNSIALDSEEYVEKEVDMEIMGVGKKITAPPSIHPSGRTYRFLNQGTIYEVDLKELIENYYKLHCIPVELEEYREILKSESVLEFDVNSNLNLNYANETALLLELIKGAPCEANFFAHNYTANYAFGSILMQKHKYDVDACFEIWDNLFGSYEDHDPRKTKYYLNWIKNHKEKLAKKGFIKKHGICTNNCEACWIDKYLQYNNKGSFKFKIGHNVEIGNPIDINKMPKYDNQRIEMNQGLIFKTIQKIKDPYKEMALIKTMPGSGKTRTVMEFMNGRNDCIYVAPSHDLINRSGFSGIHIYGMRYLCPKIQFEKSKLKDKSDRTKTELIMEITGARFYCFKYCNKQGKCDYWNQYKQDFENNNIAIVYHSLASHELHKILKELLFKKKGKKYLILDDVDAFDLLKEDDIFLRDVENNIQALKNYYEYKKAQSKDGEYSNFAHEILIEILDIYKNVLNGTLDKKEVGQVFAKYTNVITGNTKNRYSIMPYYINVIQWESKRLLEKFGDEIDIKIIPKDLSRFLVKKHHARFNESYLHYEYSMISQSDTLLDGMYKVILNATGIKKLYEITTKIKKIHTLEDNSIFKNIEVYYFTDGKYTRAKGVLYTNKKLINNIVDLCNWLGKQDEKILIKAPLDFIEVLKKHIPRELDVLYSVDFGDHGLNDYEECTCMIKVGDIEPSINLLKRCYEKKHPKKKWNGNRIIETIPYIFKNRMGVGKFLKTNSYEDKDIRQLAKELRYAEMEQGVGRLRSELKKNPLKIFMFSSYPYDFLVPTYCGTYEQFKLHNMLDEVENNILEVVDQSRAETTEQIYKAVSTLGIKIGKSSIYNKINNLLKNRILEIKDKLARGLRLFKINFNLIKGNINNSDSKEINNNSPNNLESENKNILEILKEWLFYSLNFNVWKQSDIFKKDLLNF